MSSTKPVTWIGPKPLEEHPVISEFIWQLQKYVQVRYFSIGTDGLRKGARGRLRRLLVARKVVKMSKAVVVDFFPGAAILFLTQGRHRPALYVRTQAVLGCQWRKFLFNLEVRICSRLARQVGVISGRVGDAIGVRGEALPIGGLVRCGDGGRNLETLRCVYVGTFAGRRIETMLEAVILAAEAGRRRLEVRLVGGGEELDARVRKAAIATEGLHVTVEGWRRNEELPSMLCWADVGLGWIPVTAEYDPQPAKKIIDYLLSGLVVVATDTAANREMLMSVKGAVIVGDRPDSYARGILVADEIRGRVGRDMIRRSAASHEWDAVIERYYMPFLARL